MGKSLKRSPRGILATSTEDESGAKASATGKGTTKRDMPSVSMESRPSFKASQASGEAHAAQARVTALPPMGGSNVNGGIEVEGILQQTDAAQGVL